LGHIRRIVVRKWVQLLGRLPAQQSLSAFQEIITKPGWNEICTMLERLSATFRTFFEYTTVKLKANHNSNPY
jgi:hypothetical protein